MNAWKIYGNVLVDTAGGNGVIASGGSDFVIADTLIYNNTCVNCGVILHQCGANPACASASGNVVKNNILYNGTCNIDVNLGSAVDNDYNAYLTCSAPETETNGQILTLDPFVNSAIGDTGDYHLTSSAASTLNAGLTLASPYTQDLDGNTRGGAVAGSRPAASSRPSLGASGGVPVSRPAISGRPAVGTSGGGKWDRGAYEFSG